MKTYIIVNNNGEHEYDIRIEELGGVIEYSLFATNNSHIWTEKAAGKCFLKLTDTGNGIRLDKDVRDMDYAMLTYLRLLVEINNKEGAGKWASTYKVYQTDLITTI